MKAVDRDDQARLLQHLPSGRLGCVLAVLDVARGEGPPAAHGFVGASDEENSALLLDQDRRAEGRLGVVRPTTARAARSGSTAVVSDLEQGRAPRAEVRLTGIGKIESVHRRASPIATLVESTYDTGGGQ